MKTCREWILEYAKRHFEQVGEAPNRLDFTNDRAWYRFIATLSDK